MNKTYTLTYEGSPQFTGTHEECTTYAKMNFYAHNIGNDTWVLDIDSAIVEDSCPRTIGEYVHFPTIEELVEHVFVTYNRHSYDAWEEIKDFLNYDEMGETYIARDMADHINGEWYWFG